MLGMALDGLDECGRSRRLIGWESINQSIQQQQLTSTASGWCRRFFPLPMVACLACRVVLWVVVVVVVVGCGLE
jgi:hypothetical protein